MEIYKDILKMREDFLKKNNLNEIKKIMKKVKIEKFPIVDNLADQQISKLIEIVQPQEMVIKLFDKYNLNLDEDFSDFEKIMIKLIEGEEIDIEEDKLTSFEIIFRIYGIPFTAIWKVLKDNIDLSQFNENFCPICGGSFDYAYLNENGEKYLVCDLCRFPWRYPRIKCPICETEDQGKLSYLQFEGDYDFVRIYQCENCGESYKVLLIDKIKNFPSVEIANIETIPLEFSVEES